MTLRLFASVFLLASVAAGGCGDDDPAAPAQPDAVGGGQSGAAAESGTGGAGRAGQGGQSGAAAESGTGGAGRAGQGGRSGAGSGGEGGAAGAAAGSGGAGGSVAQSTGRWVSGYYVGYQRDLYAPADIEWSGLTHLVVGRATPTASGGVNTTYDIDETSGPQLAKQLVDLAHQNGKRAILMMGGAGEYSNWVSAASEQNRARFVDALIDVVRDGGYDGIDLDWEPIETTDQAPLRALAEALHAKRPGIALLLPVNWVGSGTAVPHYYGEIADLFAQINVMSYAMAGAWPGWQSWHSSALTGESETTPTSIESSVDAYIEAGVPADKLGIGIGFFGMCWTPPVDGPKQGLGASVIAADDNAMSYTNIMASYYSADARQWDAEAKVPYLSFAGAHGPSGCGYVSYDDEQSIAAKAEYVKSRGLGGAIIWTINQGHLPNAPTGQRDPLLKAMSAFFD